MKEGMKRERNVRKCGLKGPREQTYSRRYNTTSSMKKNEKNTKNLSPRNTSK